MQTGVGSASRGPSPPPLTGPPSLPAFVACSSRTMLDPPYENCSYNLFKKFKIKLPDYTVDNQTVNSSQISQRPPLEKVSCLESMNTPNSGVLTRRVVMKLLKTQKSQVETENQTTRLVQK